MSRITANSTNPAHGRYGNNGPQSVYSQSPYANMTTRGRGDSVYSQTANGYGAGPQGYPPHDGFEFEPDDDEFEDYPPSTSYASSGRGTPVGAPRRGNAMSMPPERDAVPGYDRPRAQTEDTNGPVMAQWRNNQPPSASLRPVTPRLTSNASYASDASFGNGVRPRPPLRSQFSSTKLKAGYEGGEYRNASPALPSPASGQPPPMIRSRSASQPTAYVPKTVPPPLPSSDAFRTASQWSQRSENNKRGSGSSQSTGDSSDYSPNSSSPITPFGSSDSSLAGIGIRTSRSQHFEGVVNGNGHLPYPPVKVKVHFNEDIFVIQVSRATEYDELVEKVGRKIRLCGPRRDDGPLRVKYKDEDGDMVSLGSTEDVQMAFEQFRPGGQVTLFVT